MLDDFQAVQIETGETTIFARRSGSGPPILLLHGFPQTHLMWRGVAPLLARDFTVVCADLRGYGRSGCPASAPDHAPYAKRAMARDMVSVMERLGVPALRGRGTRSRRARRLSDGAGPSRSRGAACGSRHPADRDRLGAGRREIRARLLALVAAGAARAAAGAHPDARRPRPSSTTRWGMGLSRGGVSARGARGLRGGAAGSRPRPRHLRGVSRRRDHRPRARPGGSCAQGRRIACPLLVLWSAAGALDTWYVEAGGTARALAGVEPIEFRGTRSMPAISSRRRLPSRRPRLWAASSAPTDRPPTSRIG